MIMKAAVLISKFNLKKFKRELTLVNKNLNTNTLKLNNGFLLVLSFSNLTAFEKLLKRFVHVINSVHDKKHIYYYLSSNFLRSVYPSSSSRFLYYCSNVFILFLFVDLLLRYKVHFYINYIFNIKENCYSNFFTLGQIMNQQIILSPKTLNLILITKLQQFCYNFIIRLMCLLYYANNNNSIV
jgi:hypothetical protein